MKVTHYTKPRDNIDISYATQGESLRNIYWSTFSQWPSSINWTIPNPKNLLEINKWAESQGFTLESRNTNIKDETRWSHEDSLWVDRSVILFINNEKKLMLLTSTTDNAVRLILLFPGELHDYCEESYGIISDAVGTTKTSGRVNLVAIEQGDFFLTSLSIPKPDLNLELNYGHSFAGVHKGIKSILDSRESGLILLHGISGSGKSTYIYHIIHEFTHKMIFVPNNMVPSITNPEFINFLIHNAKNSVLIIEDAEKVLLKRSGSGDSGVSTLLNITDGVLGQVLKCKVICTFNIARTELDEALLRRGRLRKEHEFGPLSVEDSNKLLKHLGTDRRTDSPLTLAEIYNEEGGRENTKSQIGFKYENKT